MSKFKGTLGKWEKDDRCNIWAASEKIALCCSSRRIEDEANALLISKSPQMLEMLEKVHELFDMLRFPTESEINEYKSEIKALINEATEI